MLGHQRSETTNQYGRLEAGVNPTNLIMVRPSSNHCKGLQNPNTTPPMILVNAPSLTQRTDELDLILQVEDIDTAAVTETWFPESIDSNYFDIPNYTLRSIPRRDRRGGGVALYVKNDIQTRSLTEISVPAELEVLWSWAHP